MTQSLMLQLLSNPPEPAQHDTVMVLHPSSDPPEPAQHDTVMMLQLLSDPPEPAQRDTVMMLQPSSDLRETTERDKGTVLQQPSDQQQPVPHDASTMSQQASDPPEKVPHDASTMSQQASDSPGIRTVSDEPGDFQSCRKGGATVNLASPQGSLAWTGNNSAMKCSWRIDVTSLGIDGLVIQIHPGALAPRQDSSGGRHAGGVLESAGQQLRVPSRARQSPRTSGLDPLAPGPRQGPGL